MKPSYEDLFKGLKVAEEALEGASHGWHCAVMYLKDKNACNCWKSEALSHIKPLLKEE